MPNAEILKPVGRHPRHTRRAAASEFAPKGKAAEGPFGPVWPAPLPRPVRLSQPATTPPPSQAMPTCPSPSGVLGQSTVSLGAVTYWNSVSDKVARENNGLGRAGRFAVSLNAL